MSAFATKTLAVTQIIRSITKDKNDQINDRSNFPFPFRNCGIFTKHSETGSLFLATL